MSEQILISFDVEEFDFPREKGQEFSLEEGVAVTDAGLKKILAILKKTDTKATFFVTGNFARLRPQSVRSIVDAGHEVGAHGVDHFSAKDSDISEAKVILERTLKGTGSSAKKAVVMNITASKVGVSQGCKGLISRLWQCMDIIMILVSIRFFSQVDIIIFAPRVIRILSKLACAMVLVPRKIQSNAS